MRSATDRPSSDVAPGSTITSLPSTVPTWSSRAEHVPHDVGDGSVGNRRCPLRRVGDRIDFRDQHRHWLPRRGPGQSGLGGRDELVRRPVKDWHDYVYDLLEEYSARRRRRLVNRRWRAKPAQERARRLLTRPCPVASTPRYVHGLRSPGALSCASSPFSSSPRPPLPCAAQAPKTARVSPVVANPSGELLPDEQIQQVLNRLDLWRASGRCGQGSKHGDRQVDRRAAASRAHRRSDDGPFVEPVLRAQHEDDRTSFATTTRCKRCSDRRRRPPAMIRRWTRRTRGESCSRRTRSSPERRAQTQQLVGQLQSAKLARAVTSERQLNEVMVDFWENHFSVFAGKGQTRMFLAQYDRDVIRPNALGKFRDLLGAVAKSPAMLFFLDNWQSAADSTKPTLVARGGGRGGRAGLRPGIIARRPLGGLRTTSARGARATPERHARRARAAHAALEAAGQARLERELRARADGAAHARRRRRLHAEGRAGSRARAHRMDVQPPERRVRVQSDDPRRGREVDSRTEVPGRSRRRRGRAGARSRRARSGDGALHHDQAGAPLRLRRSAGGARRSLRRQVLEDRRRHSRDGALHRHVAGVLQSLGVSRQGEDAVRGRGVGAPRASTRSRIRRRAPRRSSRASASRSSDVRRPTVGRIAATRG